MLESDKEWEGRRARARGAAKKYGQSRRRRFPPSRTNGSAPGNIACEIA